MGKARNVGIVVVGHGSRDPEAILECRKTVSLLRESFQGIVECGYLEFEPPAIQDAILSAMGQGAESIVVLPAMLTLGRHAKDDIPNAIQDARHCHPNIPIYYGEPLGLHPNILALCQMRIKQALSELADINPSDVLLLVVGRGTSDSGANSNVPTLTRLLSEAFQVGWALGCYASVATPLLSDALRHARTLPYRTVLVFPYLLFTGVMVKKVQREVLLAQKENPDRLIKMADYLGPDGLIRDTFLERFSEAIAGMTGSGGGAQ